MSKIKAITLDAFDTTILRIGNFEDAYLYLFRDAARSLTEDQGRALRHRILTTKQDFGDIVDAYELEDNPYGLGKDQLVMNAEKRLNLDLKYAERMPGLDQLVEDAKKHNIKLAIISNLGYRYVAHVDKCTPEIETRILSYEAGFVKPHKGIFLLAAETLGVRPEEIVHIGDKRRNDVEGALAAGFGGALHHPKRYENISARDAFAENMLPHLGETFHKMQELNLRIAA